MHLEDPNFSGQQKIVGKLVDGRIFSGGEPPNNFFLELPMTSRLPMTSSRLAASTDGLCGLSSGASIDSLDDETDTLKVKS